MRKGENIKKIRQERGLTQKKLGELCGIAESTIRKYELNLLNPKLETLRKIATSLNVTISDLLDDSEWEEYRQEMINDFSIVKDDKTVTTSAYEYIKNKGLLSLEAKFDNIGFSIVVPEKDTDPSQIVIMDQDGKYVNIDKEVLLRLDRESDSFLLFKLENYIKEHKK